MNTHPLAYSNYLRFSAIVRQREYFQDEEMKDLYSCQEREGFANSQGSTWCLGSLIGKAWIERRYEIRSLANALEKLEEEAPEWANPKALAWLVAASWEPKGDPLDPKSLHLLSAQEILEKKLKSLTPEQWFSVGQEAMGILDDVWERGSTLDSPSRTAERHGETWFKFSMHWAEGGAMWPFAAHPEWPQWVAGKVMQTLSARQIGGIRADDVRDILGMEGNPTDSRDVWVGAWTQVAEHAWRLFQALDSHPQASDMQRTDASILAVTTGSFLQMAYTHGHPETLAPSLGGILTDTSNRLSGWGHGVVPFTERQYLGGPYDGLRNRLQEIQMDLNLDPGMQSKKPRGRQARL